MKNLIIWVLFWAPISLMACDVCSGASMSQRFGVLPDYRFSTLGLNYQTQQFSTTYPTNLFGVASFKSEEGYHTLRLDGRFFVSRSIILTGSIPFINSQQTIDSQTTSAKGLGDISAGIQHIKTFGSDDEQLIQWINALQIKLPTGASRFVAQESELSPSIPLQLGSGSTDLLFSTGFLFRKNNWGVQSRLSAKWNSSSPDNYRVGNRYQASIQSMYWIPPFGKQTQLIPFAEVNFSHSRKDMANTEFGIYNAISGGNQVMGGVGLNLFRNKIGSSIGAEIPLWQNLADGRVEQQFVLNASLTFLFL